MIFSTIHILFTKHCRPGSTVYFALFSLKNSSSQHSILAVELTRSFDSWYLVLALVFMCILCSLLCKNAWIKVHARGGSKTYKLEGRLGVSRYISKIQMLNAEKCFYFLFLDRKRVNAETENKIFKTILEIFCLKPMILLQNIRV